MADRFEKTHNTNISLLFNRQFMFRMKLYPSSLLTIALYVCSHGMSYPISGLVKSYKAKQYEVEHPLVVGHLKVIIFYAKQRTVLAQVPTAGLLSCLRVKPASLNFLQMITAQEVGHSQQQSYSGLRSPGRSCSTYFNMK